MAVVDVLIFNFTLTWNLKPNWAGIKSSHKQLHEEKLQSTGIPWCSFLHWLLLCPSSSTARRKRTNKRKDISILIPTQSGLQPVHHVIAKMLMLAAVIFLRWWIETKILLWLCCIWEQLLDCVVPKVCPWHGEELPKITFPFWCSSIMEWFWAEEPPEDSISWLKSFAFYFCGPSCKNHKYLNRNCDTFLWHSSGKASKRSSKWEQTMSTNPSTPGPAGQMAQE